MTRKIDSNLYRGCINRELSIEFFYTYTDEGKYQPIVEKGDTIKIYPSHMLTISEGYGKPFVTIMSNSFYQFVALLDKAVKHISENLYEIFPDVGKIEFEMDSKTMEIYQTEKAMTTNGMTMYPTVWVDAQQQCYPAIKFTTLKQPSGIIIPLEDAIPISKMLNAFDPHVYGLTLLRILGVIG